MLLLIIASFYRVEHVIVIREPNYSGLDHIYQMDISLFIVPLHVVGLVMAFHKVLGLEQSFSLLYTLQ